jgi:hypothetical protein
MATAKAHDEEQKCGQEIGAFDISRTREGTQLKQVFDQHHAIEDPLLGLGQNVPVQARAEFQEDPAEQVGQQQVVDQPLEQRDMRDTQDAASGRPQGMFRRHRRNRRHGLGRLRKGRQRPLLLRSVT